MAEVGVSARIAVIAERMDAFSAQPRWRVELAAWSAFALWVRLLLLGQRYLDRDESYSFARMMGINNPYPILPPYYWLMARWSDVAGNSLLALRIPSVIFSVMAFALVLHLAARCLRPFSWRLVAVLTALSPFEMLYAQYFRPYTMVSLCLVLLVTLIHARTWTWPRSLLALLLVLFAFLSHYYALVGFAFLTAGAVAWKPDLIFRHKRIAVVASVLIAGLVLWAIPMVFRGGYSVGTILWDGPLSFLRTLPEPYGARRALDVFNQFCWGLFLDPAWQVRLKPLTILLVAWLMITAWNARRDAVGPFLRGAVTAILVGPISVLYLQNGVGFTPAVPKYLHSLAPLWACALAVSWDFSARRRGAAAWMGSILIGCAIAAQVYGVYATATTRERHNMMAWQDVMEAVSERASADEALVAGPSEWHGCYYWKTTRGDTIPLLAYPGHMRSLPPLIPVTPEEWSHWRNNLDQFGGVWVIAESLWEVDPGGLMARELTETWVLRSTVTVENPEPGRPATLMNFRRPPPDHQAATD